MSATWKTVRVFISSTFRDMHAERDHLVTVVFPELRERVEQLGLEFFDVDLRWGVPSKDANGETANSWEYCRQWIDRVEPFFVCILGQRYGWLPPPEALKDSADRQRQQANRRSITDMEVRHAVLDTTLKRRSYFYLCGATAPDTATEFVDPPPLLAKLDELKGDVRGSGRPVRDYPCKWTGNAFTGMEEFGRRVLEDLWFGVLRDPRYVSKDLWQQALGHDPDTDPFYTHDAAPIPDDLAARLVALAKPMPKDPLDVEREQMAAFAASRLRWFQGRTEELQNLTDLVASAAPDAPRLAVVAAAPGQGKSALLAKLAQSLSPPDAANPSAKDRQSPILLISHFVGATEHSATAHELVRRLLDELDRSGISWPPEPEDQEPKLDFNSLTLLLAQRLGEYAGERRIVILLDALNQLSDGHELHWLPHRLGPGVSIIASCVDDPAANPDSPEARTLAAFTSRQPALLRIPLGPLGEADVRTIVVEYLKEYCKELDTSHVNAICRMKQTKNPLYLLVMLAELRTLGGNDMNLVVPKLIASMATDYPDTVSLFRWVLQRMEVFGKENVQWWCLYLAHGRAGMASHELSDLLARKLGSESAEAAEEARRKALRLERGLRRYLQRRGGQLDFFHGQLRQAVIEQFGAQAEAATVHFDIAIYFHEQADFLESLDDQRARVRRLPPTCRPANGRKAVELVYQWLCVIRAPAPANARFESACEALEQLLMDLFYLEAKAEAGFVFELAEDFANVLAVLPPARSSHRILCLIEEAIRRDISFVARHSTTLFQCLWNTCWWYDCPEAAEHYVAPGGQKEWGKGTKTGNLQPWLGIGHKLYVLMEGWRQRKEQVAPGFHWLRSLRPPPLQLGSAQLAIMRGHVRGVEHVAYSPEGDRIVSGSDDNTVRVWDSGSGAELAILRGHEDRVNSVIFSLDGNRIVSGSDDMTVRVWDARNGAELAVLRGHECRVQSVAYSSGGDQIVSGSDDDTVRVWDANSGATLAVLRGHEKFVNTFAFSPGGDRIVSGSGDPFCKESNVRIWDAYSGASLFVFSGHKGTISSITFSPDGDRIVSGSDDKTVHVWDSRNGVALAVLHGHEKLVTSVAFSPNGDRIVSGSADNTVRIWNAHRGAELAVFRGHEDWVKSVGFSPDGNRIVSGSADNTVRIWDAHGGSEVAVLRGQKRDLDFVAFPTGKDWIVSGSFDHTLFVWDACNGAKIAELIGHERNIGCVAFSSRRDRIVSGSDDHTLRMWDALSGAELAVFRGHGGRVLCVALSSGGNRIVSGSDDRTVRVWNARSGMIHTVMQGHESRVNGVSISPGGDRIASVSDDGTVRVWNAVSGAEQTVLSRHKCHVNSVLFSPGGDRIISGLDDGTVRMWDASRGSEMVVLRGHKDCVIAVTFSPSGDRIASASLDGTVRVWDTRSGECIEVVTGSDDLQAIAAGALSYPLRAQAFLLEIAIEKVESGRIVTWFPPSINQMRIHHLGRTWSGSVANHLYLIRLEGGDP